jgi:hypothetical protein
VKKILVPQRENPVVNRLNKTKIEKFPDLQMEKEEKLKTLRKKDQAAKLERVRPEVDRHSANSSNTVQKKEDARIAQERKDKKWQKDHAYDELFAEDDPEEANNQNRGEDLEDDFM